MRTSSSTRSQGRQQFDHGLLQLARGPTLYPSQLGPVHKALGKKDYVGDVLSMPVARDLSVVAYYSAVYNNAAFLEHPDWRILPHNGVAAYENNRYGTCCQNSPYTRDFAVAQTEELCSRYEFDGIFFEHAVLALRLLLPALRTPV